MNFSVDDVDIEISFDAEFLFPVLFPFIFTVFFKDDHFCEVCTEAIEKMILFYTK